MQACGHLESAPVHRDPDRGVCDHVGNQGDHHHLALLPRARTCQAQWYQ